MGFLDSIFGGGSKNVTSTATTSLPKWLDQAGQDIYSAGKTAVSRDYPTYTDPRIAGFNPDIEAGFSAARENAGSWAPYFEQAAGYGAEGGTPVSESDINAYMNPYIEDVVNRSTAQIARQAAQQRIQDNAALSRRGSFLNESRRAVIDNMRNESTNRAIGDTAAGLYSKGFDTALNQANQTKSQQSQAAKLFSDLAAGRVQLGQLDEQQLLGIGKMIQDLQQQGLTLNYQDFLNEFYYPQDQLSWLNSQIQGIPSNRTTTQQYPVGTPNLFGQVAGLGTALGGLFSAPAGGTSAIQGIANLF